MELTEHQKKCWKAYETHGSITATAKALNMERSDLKRTLAIAILAGEYDADSRFEREQIILRMKR